MSFVMEVVSVEHVKYTIN